MDWILDHLQIIIAVAGAIAYWLNARSKDKAGEPADYDGDGTPDNTSRSLRGGEQSPEEQENNRRAQELIRRLRAEREGRPAAEPPPLVRPVSSYEQPVPPAPQRDLYRERMEARRAELERESSASLERQRALAEQLSALKARKAESEREAKSAFAEPAAASGSTTARAAGGAGLLAELRNARSLRKAIITREVLGTPVGLR